MIQHFHYPTAPSLFDVIGELFEKIILPAILLEVSLAQTNAG
jgi:hypothetical protein